MREQSAKAEFEIAWIARRQHGVVSVEQLRAIGIDKSGVARRVRAGRLHRLHRGVYAVGHAAPSLHRDFMAAVLVCGKGAALSHGSAAVLWGFLEPLKEPIHVTSPSPNGRKRHSGVILHRSPSLKEKGMATVRERIRVTTPRRTIDDLEGAIEPRLFRRAKRQAELKKYKLNVPTDRTRSDLERDFLRFLAKHGFPRTSGLPNPMSRAWLGKQIKDAGSVACFSTRATEDAEMRRPDALGASTTTQPR